MSDAVEPYTLAHSDRVEHAVSLAENVAWMTPGCWRWALDWDGDGAVEAWAYATPHPSRPDPITFHVSWTTAEWAENERLLGQLARMKGRK